MDYEQSKVIKEQRRSMRIDNRRKAFDERQYELANTPSEEDIREQNRITSMRRALNDPPMPEILSGRALNDLMNNILRQQSTGAPPGPVIPLEDSMLSQINVTAGESGATTGLLRDRGRLTWPLTLRGDDYKTDRDHIDQLIKEAIQQSQSGQQVDASVINDMTTTINTMLATLKGNIDNVTAGDYIAARRYLTDLQQAVQTLQNPNASNYVTGRWSARGNTVAELVQNMSRQGLRFAPADPGASAAYTSLQRAMASYVMGTPTFAMLQAETRRPPRPAPPPPPANP